MKRNLLLLPLLPLSGVAFAQCKISIDYTPKNPVVGDTVTFTIASEILPGTPPSPPPVLDDSYAIYFFDDNRAYEQSAGSVLFDPGQRNVVSIAFPTYLEGPFSFNVSLRPHAEYGYPNPCDVEGTIGQEQITGQIAPVPFATSPLTGQYQLVFNGTAANGTPTNQVAALGSITLDGKGNVTGGILDLNGSLRSYAALPVTGTYTLAGGQGTLDLETKLGDQTFAFRTASSSTNHPALITQLDLVSTSTGVIGLGSLRQLPSGTPTLASFYSVRLTAAPPPTVGYPALFSPAVLTGMLQFTAGGPVGGVLAISSSQTGYLADIPEYGEIGAPDAATGRFTFTLKQNAQLAQPPDYVGYLDGNGGISILSTDSAKTSFLITGSGH